MKEDRLKKYTLDLFNNKGMLTGSRLFLDNNVDKSSDYDFIVFLDSDVQEIIDDFTDYGDLKENGSSEDNRLRNYFNVKFTLNSGEVVNLIIYKYESDIPTMKKVNELMMKLPKRLLEDKYSRHRMFEIFTDIMFGRLIDEDFGNTRIYDFSLPLPLIVKEEGE